MAKACINSNTTPTRKRILNQENVNECHTVLVKNLIKESFYRKRKKSNYGFDSFFYFP